MNETGETKLVFLGEVVVKLFALYTLLYFVFFHAGSFLVRYNLFQEFGQANGNQLLQLARVFLTPLLPIGGAVILLWRGSDIARWLLPAETTTNLEQIKSKYVISLLLTVVAVYYIFTGGAMVISWVAKWLLSDPNNILVTYSSNFSPDVLTGGIQLVMAFLLFLYISPVADWINLTLPNDDQLKAKQEE